MKNILSITLLVIGAAITTHAATLGHVYSFNNIGTGNIKYGSSIKDDMNVSGKEDEWTFYIGRKGEPERDSRTVILPPTPPDIFYPPNPPHEYSPTIGYGYGNYIVTGAPNNKTGGDYLYAKGDILNMKDSWSYSVVMWVNDSMSGNEGISIFSIGDSNNGMRFMYTNDNTLKLELYTTGSDNLYKTLVFDEVASCCEATLESSNFHHMGISFSKDADNNLTVNYYINGVLHSVGSKNIGEFFSGVESFNGLYIGADGTTSMDSLGTSSYDDIRIYEGVLTEEEAKNSMKPFDPSEIPAAPAVPEPTSSALALLGLAGMAFRRRR